MRGNYERRNDNIYPKPFEDVKEYNVKITEISEGITRIQGFVIFVKANQISLWFATAKTVNG